MGRYLGESYEVTSIKLIRLTGLAKLGSRVLECDRIVVDLILRDDFRFIR